MPKNMKSIILNAIGFLITFSIVIAIFVLYDNSKGTNIYERTYFKVNSIANFEVDKTFIGSFYFDVNENESKEIFKTYIEFKEYFFVLENFTGSDGLDCIVQVKDSDGIEETEEVLMQDYICTYEVRNDVSFKLIIDNNTTNILKGTINVYALKENTKF